MKMIFKLLEFNNYFCYVNKLARCLKMKVHIKQILCRTKVVVRDHHILFLYRLLQNSFCIAKYRCFIESNLPLEWNAYWWKCIVKNLIRLILYLATQWRKWSEEDRQKGKPNISKVINDCYILIGQKSMVCP